MDTTFINSGNSKTRESHGILFTLSEKINLKETDEYVVLSNLSIYSTWKNVKSYAKTINLNISSKMEWRIRITWWIIFCIIYLRSFKSTSLLKNMKHCRQKKQIKFRNWQSTPEQISERNHLKHTVHNFSSY